MKHTLTHLNIELTSYCNQNCAYCFNSSNKHGTPAAVSLNEWHSIFLHLKKFSDLESVHFTGGEPFTHPDICKILEIAFAAELAVSVLSNGFRIAELCERESDLMSRLRHAQVSLDSLNEKKLVRIRRNKNAYADAVSAITSLRRVDVPVEISAVSTSKSLPDDITDLRAFADTLGCTLLLRDLEEAGRNKSCRLNSNDAPKAFGIDRYFYLPSSRNMGVPLGIRTITSSGAVEPTSFAAADVEVAIISDVLERCA